MSQQSAAPPAGVTHAAPAERSVPIGIGLILLCSITITLTDTGSKYLSQSMHPMQFLWLRFGVCVILLLPVLAMNGGMGVLRTTRPGLQFVRAALFTAGVGIYTWTLAVMPIGEATAMFFIYPVFVTALSIPVLHEKVGALAWAAALAGFAGVAIIMRPGTAAFQPVAFIVMGAAVIWAGNILATRLTGVSENSLTTLIWSMVFAFVALAIPQPWIWTPLDGGQWALIGMVGAISLAANWLLVAAYRYAGASTLAPFTYAPIVWAVLSGIFFFGDPLNPWSLGGAALILASGLAMAYQARR